MIFGFSGESFANFLTVGVFIGLIVCALIFYMAHKQGVDVTKHNFQLRVLLGIACVFVILPLCLSDLNSKSKIIGSVFAFTGGLINYFGIDRLQKIIKNQSTRN